MFQEEALVFARYAGHEPWPARVTDVLPNGRFKVLFYGTYDYGICKASNLIDYREGLTIKKLNTHGTKRQQVFKRALQGIKNEHEKRANAESNIDSSYGDKRTKPKALKKQNQNNPENKVQQATTENEEAPLPEKETPPTYELVLPPSEFVDFDKIEEWENCVYDLLESAEDPDQKSLMEGIYDLVEATIHLQQTLFTKKPDFESAMKLIDKIKSKIWQKLDASKLQQVLDAIAFIRNYTCDAEPAKLKEQYATIIEFIRTLSSEVFLKIVSCFPDLPQDPEAFWIAFQQRIKESKRTNDNQQ